MDREEFKLIKQGDLKTFEKIFRNHYSNLCNYVFKIIKDKDAAEEIIQQLFYQIWEKRENMTVTSSLKSYLYRSAYNNAVSYLRHEKIKNQYGDYMKTYAEIAGNDPSDELKTRELDEAINKTLEELPEKSRLIFTLNRFEGMKYREIAKQLSVSVKTVEAGMGKALKLFRKNLANYLETI